MSILGREILVIPDGCRIGKIVDEKGIAIALALEKENTYLSLDMNQVSTLLHEGTLGENWTNMEECVLRFNQDFGEQKLPQFGALYFQDKGTFQ